MCFANPGTTEMWLVDGLSKSPVRAVLGLHETVCSGAADGYGRLSRKLASTLLHLGPGLANALANLHNARRASTPVLNLIGTMASWHETADPLLGMDITALARSVSKSVITTTSSDSAADSVRMACAATKRSDQAGGSRVSTVIIPHDHTWPQESNAATGKPGRCPADALGICLTGMASNKAVASCAASVAWPILCSSLPCKTALPSTCPCTLGFASAGTHHFVDALLMLCSSTPSSAQQEPQPHQPLSAQGHSSTPSGTRLHCLLRQGPQSMPKGAERYIRWWPSAAAG